MPPPIPAIVERAIQVYVAIAQFAKHIGQYLKQLFAIDIIARAYLIYIINRVPVNIFIVEEAVVLIDYLPQRLEVALRGVFVLDFVDT
jgi:hypothetical protein